MSLLVKFILFYYFARNFQFIVCSTVTCDFEIDECAWSLDTSWKIYPSGSTPETASSGPVVDHTTGNGSYVRFMAARLAESNLFGIMSTNVPLQESTLFSFWYFMHGTQIGTLTLVLNDEPVWQKSGRQGVPAWYRGNVTLPPDANLRIAFVANRTGLGRSSDIALDDIVLQREQLPLSTRTTRLPSTTSPRIRYNASCDFDIDKELCSWKSDTKYGWKVITEREINITIGPSSDYSSIMRANDDAKLCKIPYEEKSVQYYYCIPNKKILQCKGSDNKWINCRNGGFVQIQTNQFNEIDERSQFESPVLDALSGEGCVQFHYTIAGSDNDWLNVYVEDYWSGNQLCVWHMNGSSVPDRWIAAEAPLKMEKNGKYKIVFEARKGKAGGIGLVSLDHIIVIGTQCSDKYPVIKCPVEEVTTTTTITTSTTTTTITTSTTTTTITTSTTTTTSTITTSTTTTATSTHILTTSSSAVINTSEMMITTDKNTDSTMTTQDIHTTTISINTDSSTFFHNTTITPTSTTTSTTTTTTSSIVPRTTTTSQTKTSTTSEARTSTSTFRPLTTRSPTPYTTTSTTSKINVDDDKTTTPVKALPKKSSVGPIVGTLVGVCTVMLIVGVYLNRQKLRTRFGSRSTTDDGIIPRYSNSDATGDFVRLENIRDRCASA